MRLPKRDIGGFARELIERCTKSRATRLMRGAYLRNMFLTGDPSGNPQTYNKTNLYIEKMASWLYSPVDMRFGMGIDGSVSPSERAMGRAAVAELHKRLRRGNVDRKVSTAVLWSLVKGKAFLKLRWTSAGFEADVVQPEVMAVEREDLSTLDEQQAFVHTSWYTVDSFVNLVWNNEDRDGLLRKAAALASATQSPPGSATLKNVMVGGGWNSVYQSATQSPAPNPNQGVVDWMGGPAPELSPELAARIIQVDEVWVWDDEREDYTTIQMLSGADDGAVIEGKYQHRNLFASAYDRGDNSLVGRRNPDNPILGLTPFVEFCPNDLDGYFWGMSEVARCGLLQIAINRRIDGINLILRRQENPPRAFIGMAGVTQNNIARLNRPGGYMVEPQPTGKIENMQPDLPASLWQSLHELIGMFDEMGGVTPTLGGEGDAGVRSQSHAETLLRSSTPHIKDRAIDVERSVAEVGNLGLQIMKAVVATKFTAWVRTKEAGIESAAAKGGTVEEPPVKDMAPIEFLMADLPDNMYATIDGHSSSPAFVHEHQQLMLQLSQRGAVSPEMLIRSIHPPHEQELIDDMERRAVDQAEMIQAHPELLTKGHGGHPKH